MQNEVDKISDISVNDKIDLLEKDMLDNFKVIECPVIHRFTKGMYIREIFMPKGALITSKIHLTQHPYIISKGSVIVGTEKNGLVELSAPFTGITEPNTRRALYIKEDCVWVTFHPIESITGEENNLTDEEKEQVVKGIEEIIIEKHENTLIGDKYWNELKLLKEKEGNT